MQGRGKHKNSDDPFNRLPHADMRNTLGLANPLALIERQQLRFFGSLLRDHRHRPTPVTVILAGRLDSTAYRGLNVGNLALHRISPHTDILDTFFSLTIRYMTEEGDEDRALELCRTELGCGYSDGVAELAEWDDIVERPISKARSLEAECPVCKRWYNTEADVKQHWNRRHAELPMPATTFHHPAPASEEKRGRRQQQQQQRQQQQTGHNNWSASQEHLERVYLEEAAAAVAAAAS